MIQEAAKYMDVTIKLPKDMADIVSVQEIIALLTDKSLTHLTQ